MKVQHVTRLSCEGCSFVVEFPHGAAPVEMPEHRRGDYAKRACGVCRNSGAVWSVDSYVLCECQRYTEERCIAANREDDEEERLRREDIDRKRDELVAACATDPAFLALCAVYRDEDGRGNNRGLLDRAMEQVADRICVSTEAITDGYSAACSDLMADCIKAAHAAGQGERGE